MLIWITNQKYFSFVQSKEYITFDNTTALDDVVLYLYVDEYFTKNFL
ncbi:hypothetical protein SAMN04490247_3188 [Salimicrobium halophilum]|uniref:Uncharacterized protein n=1 Tax=Salimicrobium halophilum TaxID=86666 RepID=A0A1G8WJB2_9BACI|nr:hypothetical protein SAMN04490247_3188 [Salimicrobium halophilum]